MHPFAVAKKIATFGWLYGRRTYLTLVAGGFKKDLEELMEQALGQLPTSCVIHKKIF